MAGAHGVAAGQGDRKGDTPCRFKWISAEESKRVFHVQASMISLSGLLEGVMTGVTIAIILGLYGWIKWHVVKRKQINHLRHLISQGYDRIIRESGFYHQDQVINASVLQYHLFRKIIRDIDDALKYRANSLDFKKVHEIKMILIEIDSIINALDLGIGGYHKTPDKEFYETYFFGKFRKLKWLDLPQ